MGAQRAFDEALAYAGERKTFGVPIGAHQLIQQKIANMYTNVLAGRGLVHRAAIQFDQGERNTLNASAAKLHCSRIANNAAYEAVQVFGGNGFNSEYPVGKLLRDARIFEIYEGTTEIQQLIIPRELLFR